MSVIREQEYTFVTNNRSDFLDLHSKEALHSGVIVIVSNVVSCSSVSFSRQH
jgi:hypothetical protein